MSSADYFKVQMAYFPTQPDDIYMNKVGTEPTPLRIIKFQKYLQKCSINIPTNWDSLGLLGTILSKSDYKIINNNQTWVAPTDPGTAQVLPTASTEGASTILALEKSTEHTNRLLQYQHDVCQHKKDKKKYDKYQAGLTALRNLITTNNE